MTEAQTDVIETRGAGAAAEADVAAAAEAEAGAAAAAGVADVAGAAEAEAAGAAGGGAEPGAAAEAEAAAAAAGSGLSARRRPVIAVVHASVGSGHRVAAEAVAQALESLGESCAERYLTFDTGLDIKTFDILDFGRIRFDGDKTASMFNGATRPIYDITWRYWLTGRLLWNGGTIWSHLMFPEFTRWVREARPAAIVTTHITAANVAVGARMISGQDYPIICVPTDYEVEGMWPHRYGDVFCVATESMAETLRARKVDEERITLTGIPARSEFNKGYDRDEIRRLWGIPANKHIALVLAGAALPAPYLRFREILDRAIGELALIGNLHLVFLTGRDEDYRRALEERFAQDGMANAMALGYTEDVARLMAASDFVICKPGGLTVTECLCTETPMLLVGRAYGQEKCNARLLTSLGAALHVQTARELVAATRHLVTHSPSLEAMKSNENYIARPDAAMRIALCALQSAWEQRDEDTQQRRRERHFMSFYWGHQPAHTR
jgi:processive 1,2-diacylglycerol beta-glucosyltransferase